MSSLVSIFHDASFSQKDRLLRLSFPLDDGPSATDSFGRVSKVRLVVDRLDAEEGLSRDFKYSLILLADKVGIALKDMMGKLLVVSLVRADGTLRHFSGYVFEFSLIKSDAGVAHYRAVLRPWLHYLTLRRNDRLFHQKNLHDQAADILADYGVLPAWDWRVRGEDGPFTMACQFGESDHNYLHRRLEAAGCVYWYEHDAQGHKWVVSDDTTLARPIDGNVEVRFQNAGGTQEEDAIVDISPVRGMASGHSALSGFDFKSPRAVHVEAPTVNRQGEVPSLEVHEYAGAYGFKNRLDGDALTRRRMEEIEAKAKHFEAAGNNRRVLPGRFFQLTDHFDIKGVPDGELLVIDVHHRATNNYLQEADELAGYSNTLTCIRKSIPWRPGRGFESVDTKILTVQTATVVGPAGEGSLHVDEYGRIRVQFHWDRIGAFDERSSAWVRVSSNWAGGEKGLLSLPRVGSEVIVQWLDGNPDHPIVMGSVYNQNYMPPWTLPDQKALSGIRSRELADDAGNSPGGKSNHVILDDTAGQLQVKVRSDPDASELNLGHIVRIDSTRGRTDQRGQGFELRTEGHGALRSAKGLLLTTEARPNAQAHVTDMPETVARLTQARDQHEALSEAAQQAKAQEAGDQDEVTKAIKGQNDALKGNGGNRSEGVFPEFQEPHLTLASPVGIETTTGGSTHMASDQHNALTSGAHTSIAAGKSTLISAKEAVRIAAFEKGIRLVAAAADIDIRALKDCINVLAKMNVSVEGEDILIKARNNIRIEAGKEVLVNGGTSYTTWNAAGVEHATKGVYREWAGSHSLVGPKSQPVPGTQTLPGATVLCVDCLMKALRAGSVVAKV